MSLVGSLEDLGLGDILQIVSLSRKSGLLRLRSEHRSGRITLVFGQVRTARIDGEPGGVREVLVGGGFLPEDEFKLAADAAVAQGLRLEPVLAERAGLPPERVTSLLREQVEQAVIEMLSWRVGEFSFEVRDELESVERERMLPSGVDAQYFAIQATRLSDEGRAGEGGAGCESAKEPVFSGEPCAEREVPVVAPESPPASVPVAGLRAPVPLVVVDPELAVLEWLKGVVGDLFVRVHIFQDVEAGVARMRQYLARDERPAVLLGVGEAEAREQVRRLRGLCEAVPVLLLRDQPGEAAGSGGVILRPRSHRLAYRELWPDLEAEARSLREALAPWATRAAPAAPRRAAPAPRPDSLERLVSASRRLRERSSRGDVMSVVLGFAAEIFPRVAIFSVRDGQAIGMAGRGLPATGGPDARALRQLQLRVDEPACFRAVLETRLPQRARPDGPGDLRLVRSLGRAIPAEVYVAPIETGGRVAALFYADALPAQGPVGDARAVEIVLQEAGLALDHALLERALEELEGRAGPTPAASPKPSGRPPPGRGGGLEVPRSPQESRGVRR